MYQRTEADLLASQSRLFAAIGADPSRPPAPSCTAWDHDRTRTTTAAEGLLVAVAVALAAVGVGVTPADGQAPSEGVVAVQPLAAVTGVATGDGHSCAVTSDQRAVCWGANHAGQLGIGETGGPQVATIVRNRAGTGPLVGVRAVTTGSSHSCALLTNRELRCWGSSSFGQLGDGTPDNHPLPVAVRDSSGTGRLRDVVQVSAGGNNTCATLATGEARCWGNNDDGQIGAGVAGVQVGLPTAVRAVAGAGRLRGVAQVEVSPFAACARLTSGEARSWGSNLSGALGDSSTQDRPRPVVVRNAAGTGALTAVRRDLGR